MKNCKHHHAFAIKRHIGTLTPENIMNWINIAWVCYDCQDVSFALWSEPTERRELRMKTFNELRCLTHFQDEQRTEYRKKYIITEEYKKFPTNELEPPKCGYYD